MRACETVNVVSNESPGGYKVINKEDFSEEEHEVFVETPEAPVNYDSLKKEELADLLNERDIDFDLSMKKQEFINLLVKGDNA